MSKLEPMSRQFELKGAELRVQELRAEIEEIFLRYPELRSRRVTPAPLKVAPLGPNKRAISAKGRKAISDGMRQWWAKRSNRKLSIKRREALSEGMRKSWA